MLEENEQPVKAGECLHCDKELVGKQRKFCCREHKDLYNHKHIYNYKYSRDYRSRSPRNFLGQLRSYRNRKEFLSLDFLVDLYERQKGLCAISGAVLTYTQGTGKNPSNMSIDRIDSNYGYTEENVQLVCYAVNLMKGEWPEQDLLSWCKTIVDYRL